MFPGGSGREPEDSLSELIQNGACSQPPRGQSVLPPSCLSGTTPRIHPVLPKFPDRSCGWGPLPDRRLARGLGCSAGMRPTEQGECVTAIPGDAQKPCNSGAQTLSPSASRAPPARRSPCMLQPCSSYVTEVPTSVGLGRRQQPVFTQQCSEHHKHACCQHQRKSFTNVCTVGFLPLKWTHTVADPHTTPAYSPLSPAPCPANTQVPGPTAGCQGQARTSPPPGFPGRALSGWAIHRPSAMKQIQ